MIRIHHKAGVLAAIVLAASAATSALAAPLSVDVRIGPPPVRYEAVPAPRAGHVWTPGYWDWQRNRHHWVAGTWVSARPGYVYAQPTWVNSGGRWHLYRGAWARGGGDRDHDGIPNRYDRHDDRGRVRGRPGRDRDHDGIPNRYDRDRDGDGIRNGRDRHPNNPNRR